MRVHRWLCVSALVLCAALAARADEMGTPSEQLAECEESARTMREGIAAIKSELEPLLKTTAERAARIQKYVAVRDKVNSALLAARVELDGLSARRAKLQKRKAALAGDGALGRGVRYLDDFGRADAELTRLGKAVAAAQLVVMRQERLANEAVRKSGVGAFGDLEELTDKILELEARQRSKVERRGKLEKKLPGLLASLKRKESACAALAARVKSQGPVAQPVSQDKSRIVRFIYGVQIPTPKSGMDLPLEVESGPEWPNVLEEFPLVEIRPSDPRTAAYFTTLREDFAAAVRPGKGKAAPPQPALFKRCAAELRKLEAAADKAKWSGSAISRFAGAHLARVQCAGQTRFVLYVADGTPGLRKAYGGVQLFGLEPGLLPVKVTVGTLGGARHQAEFKIRVRHTFRTVSETVWKDGRPTNKKVPRVWNTPYMKRRFSESWELKQKSLLTASGGLRKHALDSCFKTVQFHVMELRELPGSTPADVGPMLAKGAGSVASLVTEFGDDPKDSKPWSTLRSFADLCMQSASPEAYAALAELAPKAARSALGPYRHTAGAAYTYLAEIALMQGLYQDALLHLKTSFALHARANPKFDAAKAAAGLPTLDELLAMQKTIEGR